MESLHVRVTIKAEVGLGNLPEDISIDLPTNSSEIVASTAALTGCRYKSGIPGRPANVSTGMRALPLVLFDQRCALRWTPLGELRNNTTQAMLSRTNI
ncbi:hypothetical protein [Pseudomonas sp. G3-19]